MRRTKRIECQAVMLKAASMLERHYSVNHTYSGLTALPTQCPESGAKTYTLAATYTSDGFKLTATRAGSQTNDQCGNFTLDHTGAKEVVSGTTSLSASECWR
ncbi:MAG: type IV pilin protein [Azoarcus sp.]|nr:type IV pilin protein [Azoarcus sp.]